MLSNFTTILINHIFSEKVAELINLLFIWKILASSPQFCDDFFKEKGYNVSIQGFINFFLGRFFVDEEFNKNSNSIFNLDH